MSAPVDECARWAQRLRRLDARAELARAILDGRRDDLLVPPAEPVARAIADAAAQTAAVCARFPLFSSAHEGYGVLVEEVAELFEEVRARKERRSELRLRAEALDVAVVAIRLAALYDRARYG